MSVRLNRGVEMVAAPSSITKVANKAQPKRRAALPVCEVPSSAGRPGESLTEVVGRHDRTYLRVIDVVPLTCTDGVSVRFCQAWQGPHRCPRTSQAGVPGDDQLASPHRDEGVLRDGVVTCVDAGRAHRNPLMVMFAIGFSTGSSASCSIAVALDLRFGRLPTR